MVVVGGAFIVNVFILCNSRGATLGLLVMVCAAILLAGKGRRAKLLGVGMAGIIAVLLLADGRFIERQQTTTNATDGASEGRLEAWRAGIEVMRDYPLGGGGRAFHILSPRYIPGIVEEHRGEERAVHNTYLQLGTEWGVQGLILWSGFIGSTFLLLRRCCRQSRDNPWFFYRFFAIELALIGTLTAGIFTSRLYGESVYWMCALAVALHRIHATAVAEEDASETVPFASRVAQSPAIATRGALARGTN
jgi:O-antigen ligase